MPGRIFLVEDSVMVSGAIRMLLEANGYEVDLVATAADAIAVDASTPHDLMLLDLTLPDADGLSVIGGLRARRLLPRTVLALTGHADLATRQRCIAAGCDDVLVKPVPMRQLLQLIAERMA